MIRPDLALPPDLASDRARALALTPVSRETSERLDAFVALLLSWQRTTNLIAASTIPHLWTRHIADSLQLLDLAPDARVWADLGTGGGFPGLAAPLEVVTARAVAPLKLLLKQSFPLLGKSGAMGLFPKGQNAELELGEARAAMTSWKMDTTLIHSRTDAAGRIVVIRDVERGRTKS